MKWEKEGEVVSASAKAGLVQAALFLARQGKQTYCLAGSGGAFSNTGVLSPSLKLLFALEEADRYTDIQIGRHLIKKKTQTVHI